MIFVQKRIDLDKKWMTLDEWIEEHSCFSTCLGERIKRQKYLDMFFLPDWKDGRRKWVSILLPRARMKQRK